MFYKGKDVRFERITASTFEVFYDNSLVGIAVETKNEARFYPQPEWKYPSTYKAATKTMAAGKFITEYF